MSNPTPVYKRLGLNVIEYKKLLTSLYWEDELSQQQIATKLSAHVTIIEKHFKKYEIKTRPYTECDVWQKKNCVLSSIQLEVMDGLLLADGHLDSSPVSARLTYGCKFKDTLIDITKQFSQLHFSNPWCSKLGCWHFKSSQYRDLKIHHQRWYDERIKRVPNDIRITPVSCYWWFVGDGYQVDYGLQFCTDSFDKKSIELLRSKLDSVGFDTKLTKSSNRLRVRGRSAPRMLDWMSQNVTVADQYMYKWGGHRRQSSV